MPGPGPGCQTSFRAWRGFLRRWPGLGVLWRSCRQARWRATARSTASARLCHRCHRSATWMASGAPAAAPSNGVAPGAVPADDLHARVGIQPGAEGFRGPLRKHVHWPAGLDIDQDGAVDMPLAQREDRRPAPAGSRHPDRRRRGSAAPASTCSPRTPACRSAGRRPGRPAPSRPPAALPAGRRSAARSGWSGPAPARRTSSWCTRGRRRRTGGPAGQPALPGRRWRYRPAAAGSCCAPAATPHCTPGRPPRWRRSGPAHAPTCLTRTRARWPARPSEESER